MVVAGQVARRALMVLCLCKELGHDVLNRVEEAFINEVSS
jgi:hypothetical protein